MAKKRFVDTKFWDDDKVQSFDSETKLVFIYLLTNALSEICGIYEISIKRIVFDTGLYQEAVQRALDTLYQTGRAMYSDGYIYLRNFAKHQVVNDSVKKGIERGLEAIPKAVLAKFTDFDTACTQSGYTKGTQPSLLTLTPTLILNNTVADATPNTIVIGKESFSMEELTYEPIDGKPKSKSKYGRHTMAMLVRKFAECAQIEIKGTFDASPWSKPLSAILKYHNGDPDAAMAFIERSTGYFESHSLSFTPHTLHKNMPMIDKWIKESKTQQQKQQENKPSKFKNI